MKALVFRGAADATVENLEIPEPGPTEVLVRVAVCGVCGSAAAELDHGPILTTAPVVLGHEFSGVVEAVGVDVTTLAPGDHVVSGAGISCGECRPCRRGRTNLCVDYRTAGLQINGGLAEYTVVPATTLLDVSGSGLTLDTLGLAQPMSIAVHAVRRSGLGPDDDAIIVGVGGIGAFLTVAASAIAARVLVVDIDPDRLDLAVKLGAHHVMNARDGSLADRIEALGLHPDVLFEVSGTKAGLDSVLSTARPGSTIVPVGIQRDDVSIPVAQWTVREYTVVGTNAHVFADDLPDAVRLLSTRDDWSDVAPLVLPLDDTVPQGIEPIRTGAAHRIKTLIDPSIHAARAAVHRKS